MNDIDGNSVADGSWHNRDRLTPGTACGCFHCEAVFAADEIQRWIDSDQTALCPRCGIDAVLPGVTRAAMLRELHQSRFGETTGPSDTEWDHASSSPPHPLNR